MAAAIVTVTPNGSLDFVLRRVGPPTREEQEVEPVAETAGGKGHNVARFLAAAGHSLNVACVDWVGSWSQIRRPRHTTTPGSGSTELSTRRSAP